MTAPVLCLSSKLGTTRPLDEATLCCQSCGTPVIWRLLLGLELEAWDMVINSCPFEDLVQLSLVRARGY